jgi:hypothetical protein
VLVRSKLVDHRTKVPVDFGNTNGDRDYADIDSGIAKLP